MSHIRGLRTANCGEIVEVKTVEDPLIKGVPIIVEVLRPEKHNPTHQIICYYLFDKKLGSKVEITLYRDITDGTIGSEIYYFHGREDTQHYRSMNYTNLNKIPNKYIAIIKQLNVSMHEIFGSLIR